MKRKSSFAIIYQIAVALCSAASTYSIFGINISYSLWVLPFLSQTCSRTHASIYLYLSWSSKYSSLILFIFVQFQVLDERVYHIDSVPELPEPYYQQTGSEPRPRPVGEENGIVVFNYNPVSAVNYVSENFHIELIINDWLVGDCVISL